MARRALRGPLPGHTSLEDSMVGTVPATALQQYYEERAANRRASYSITDSEDEGEALSSRLRGSLDTTDLVQHQGGAGLASTTPAINRHGGANTSYSSSTTTVTRKVRYGLDYESDGDDFASNGGSGRKRLQHRATPLVATASSNTNINNNNTSSLLGNHLPATSLLLGNNVGSTNRDHSNLNSYSSSGRYIYTDDGVDSGGREGGVLSKVASVVKSTVERIANTPTTIRNSLPSIVLLASSKNVDSGDYDASSNTYQYTNNNIGGKLASLDNNNINAKYNSVAGGGGEGDSVSRSRSGGSSSSSVKTSPMVLRSRRRVGRSQEFEQEEQQTHEEYGEEEHVAYRTEGLNGSSSQHTLSKTSAKLSLSYLMTLVMVSSLYLVNGVASVAASSATKLSSGSRMILPLSSYAFKALASIFSGSGKSSEDALFNPKDHSYSTRTSTTDTVTQSFIPEETLSKVTGSSQQELRETTGWLSWFESIVSGLFSGRQAGRRKGKRVSWKEHSMSTRSKGKYGSDGIDDGLLFPDDVRANDYDDFGMRESDYDESDEDADEGTERGITTKTSSNSTTTTTIATAVTTVLEHLYDVCFEVEELGRRLFGVASRREERERLKQLRLTGGTGYNRDKNLKGAGISGTIYGEAEGRYGTDGLYGVRKKQGDISYELPRASVMEENDDFVAGWCWWLLPLLLLLAVFFVMTAWAYLLGADDLTSAISATAANITTKASSAFSTLATSAATTTSTLVSSLTTAAVTTFDAITCAVVFALGWALDGLSWLWSSIVGLSWSITSWSYEALVTLLSAIGNGLSADVDIAEDAAKEGDDGVQRAGVVQSALYAIYSSVSSLYFGAVSSVKTAGNGTLAVATAGTNAAWSVLLWIPSIVIAGVSAVTDSIYSFSLWVWEGLFWGVSCLGEGLGGLLWLLWRVLVGLGSLIGGGVVSMAGNTANMAIGASNSVKLTLAPIFEASSPGLSSTMASVSAPTAGRVADPPLPPSGLTLEKLVDQLLQSEHLHHRLEVVVSSEVATQTTAAAAAQAMQRQQTALLLRKLQQHHQHLERQLRQLATNLARVETSGNSERAGLSLSLDEERQQRVQQQQVLDNVHGALENISRQIEEMKRNHSLLSAEVESCCQRSLLSLADVDAHVTGLIASLIGYQAASGGDVTAPSTADLKAWMGTYFVAKEEMELQIGQLTVTLEKQMQEHRDAAVSAALAAGSARDETSTASPFLDTKTLEQTQQLVMAHVTEQLHEKLRAQLTRDLHEDIRTQLQTKIPESIEETLLPKGEFAKALLSELKQEVEAKFGSSEVESKMKLEVAAQFRSYLEEGGELKKKIEEDLVAYFEPQLHSHVALSIKKQVEDQVQARVDQELEAKLEDKLAQTRLEFKADMDVLDLKVIAEVEQNTNQNVVAALTASLPRLLPPTATQPAALNDTVRAIVAEAVAAHMGALGGHTCDQKGPLPPLPTATDANDGGESTIAAALLQSASTLAGVGIASSSGDDLNFAASGGANGNNITLTTEGLLLSRAEVQRMVAAALKKYDADRTGLADHALESGGGAIVSTRCTEPYEVNQAQLSWLGIPLYRYSTNTPRSIIQPDRNPGQCWAFKGSQGYVVMRLVAPVRPTGFTLEHIPRDVAPFGNIDSAPKNFTVWGLNTENDEGYELGSYQYQEDGDALQYYAVDNPSDDYYPFIELKINSNHGNMKYTCVYRFRVHGIRMRL